jgi:hypothetical protein
MFCGCSSSATAPFTPITNDPFGAKVQLAVGTANIFGDATAHGVAQRGLNVLVTSRQPQGYQTPGDTLPLVDTPALQGPMTLPSLVGVPDAFGATVETGPGPHDAGTGTMNATPQQNSGAPSIPPTTFGVSGGATGLGIEPFNYTSAGGNGFGQPASWVPWTIPFFDHRTINGGDPNALVPWGGPPAYDPFHDGKGVRDGNGEPPGVLGVELGLDVFANVALRTGAFQLDETIVTTTNHGTIHASATLHSTALLPAIAAPDGAALDGKGGATITLLVPAGVTEAYLQIVDVGPPPEASSSGSTVQPLSCNTASQSQPVYYTLLARGPGKHTFALPAFAGPGAPHSPVPSLCSSADNIAANASGSSGSFSTVGADVFTLQAIGFDYPAFEANYPQSSGNPLPAISGPSGQSDVTISMAKVCAQAGGSAPSAACSAATAAMGVRR